MIAAYLSQGPKWLFLPQKQRVSKAITLQLNDDVENNVLSQFLVTKSKTNKTLESTFKKEPPDEVAVFPQTKLA